ncbi:MAG: right-handed parallel beta-helix repeat-containing protein [Candidatus Brocadiia bacterium]
MSGEAVTMPDGAAFHFWDDQTDYARVYHVARNHPQASDQGDGSAPRPLRTIQRAAQVLQPSEKAVIHGGVYRECVRPARGGEGPERMIAYEAAPGEQVVVRGSQVWSPGFRPTEGWKIPRPANGATVWMGDLDPGLFAGYNPFAVPNMTSEYVTFTRDWSEEETHRFQMRRGMVLADGRPLTQVFRAAELSESDGAFWVEEPGLRLHLRLPGDAHPDEAELEVTTSEQVFAPAARHLGYIRVAGLRLEHAANGIPIPQRGLLSASRGHHWIIEDCTVCWANGLGMDLGGQDWHATRHEPRGGHVARRNRIAHCGACGIAGMGCTDGSLVEGNVVEHIGGHDVERIWECAGLKFHIARGVLIRGNVFRHIAHAAGLWLDVKNANCRITSNVFADIQSLQGAVYIECSHERNLVDGNLFWDIRTDREDRGPGVVAGGAGVNADSGENCVVAHNLFAHIPNGYAAALHINQSQRLVAGRVGLGRRHQVLNNIFLACPRRVLFSRREENASDGNLFDPRDDPASFAIQYPEPRVLLDLAAWRDYYGLDAHSVQRSMDASFDPEALELTFRLEGEAPRPQPVECLHEPQRATGPFASGELVPGQAIERTWPPIPAKGAQPWAK